MEGVTIRTGPRRRARRPPNSDDEADDNEMENEGDEEEAEARPPMQPMVRQSADATTRRFLATSCQNPPSRLLQSTRQEAMQVESVRATSSSSITRPHRPPASKLVESFRARKPVQSIFDGLQEADELEPTNGDRPIDRVLLTDRERELEREPIEHTTENYDEYAHQREMDPPPSKRRRLNDGAAAARRGVGHNHVERQISEAEDEIELPPGIENAPLEPTLRRGYGANESAERRPGAPGPNDASVIDGEDDEPFVKKHSPDQCYLCIATTTKYPVECKAHLDSMAATILACLRNRHHVDDIASLLFAYQENNMRPEFRKIMTPALFGYLVPRLSREALVEHIHSTVNASGGAELWICSNMPGLKELYSILINRTTYVRRRLNDAHVAGVVPPPDIEIDHHEISNILKLGNYILKLEGHLASDKFQLLREQSGLLDTVPRGTLDNNAIARQMYANAGASTIKSNPPRPNGRG